MTFPADPHERSPKGDHNRRLSLGLEPAEFAATAGVTPEQLRAYEFTDVDGTYDLAVAERVGLALERLEKAVKPKVANGPAPRSDETEARVSSALHAAEFADRLALSDAAVAEQLVSAELAAIDPALGLISFGERARGQLREIVVVWANGDEEHESVVAIPARFEGAAH